MPSETVQAACCMVDLTGALANLSWEVRRLLKLAEGWTAPPRRPPTQPSAGRPCRQITPSEIDQLVSAYLAGATVCELAEGSGIHRSTVGRHLRGRGVNTRPPALSDLDLSTAATLYNAGWSLAKVAGKYGVAGDTVRRRLRQADVIMRGPHDRQR